MLTAWLRKTFRGVLEAVARFFNRLGVTPNQLTLIGLLLQGIVAVVIAAGYLQLAGILLIFFSIFDAFDGTLARMTGQVSRFGAFFDATIDRYAESIVLFGLLVYYSGQPDSTTQTLLIYVAIVGSLLVSYTRAKAESLGIPCKDGILTPRRASRAVGHRPAARHLAADCRSPRCADSGALAAGDPEQCDSDPAGPGGSQDRTRTGCGLWPAWLRTARAESGAHISWDASCGTPIVGQS